MKIGLYSITYLGIWYDGPALTIPEVIGRAKRLGYTGIEIDGKRPHGNPMDLDQRARETIRNEAEKQGIEIVGVASNNDFASPIPEHRECQLLMVKEQIRLCKDLGGKVVRLFAAWPGISFVDGLASYDLARPAWEQFGSFCTRIQRWNWVRECLKEAADVAGEMGVTVALQNHAPLIRHWKDTLDLVEEVNSPALQVCLDVPIMVNQDTDYILQACHAVGSRQVHSHFGGEFERGPDGKIVVRPIHFGQKPINYPAFLRGMKEIGYDGYICYEFCHPALDAKHRPQGLAFIDEQAELAREFMQQQLDQVG